ncbi:MAG: hypothetical protein WDO56_29460 [Gammaproteobacteria bacterium]
MTTTQIHTPAFAHTKALPEGAGYFLYHSIGIFPDKTRFVSEALHECAKGWGTADDSQWPAAPAVRRRFLDLWCRRINAPSGSLTTAENVTTALYSVVGSLPHRCLRGRRVLIAADCFPSLHFLLSGLAERLGFTLVTSR